MPRAGQSDTFPPTTYADWRTAVERTLDSSASRLRASGPDTPPVEPLYAPGGPGDAEARALAGRVAGLMGTHASWRIRQAFALGTNQSDVQDALAAGMDSLELVVPHGATALALRDAASRHDRADLELSFDGLDPAMLSPGFLGRHNGSLSIGFDPIGRALAAGSLRDLDGELASLGGHVQSGYRRLLRADGAVIDHRDGAIALGRTLAVALAYLRTLDEVGLDLRDAVQCIEVRLPCGSRFFRSIARLRAARLVWARILELAGLDEPSPLYLVATTEAHRDASADAAQPWTDALRNSVVAFAAAVGSADVVQLPPGVQLASMTSSGPRRLACTTALIAREESYLRRTVDPAEGSWFLEAMTAGLAEGAWGEIARLDAAGGMVAAMRGGEAFT